LLWAFLWLKNYHVGAVGAGKGKCDEKSFCQKVWFLVKGIANVDKMLVSKLKHLLFSILI
jgi:hypothetical protein